MIFVVTLLLLAVVLLFVGYPLARPSAPEAVEAAPAPASGQRARLLAEREHALSTLKELEFEHGIGNLSDEDYAALQRPHRRKAVAILRELDMMDGGDDANGTKPALTNPSGDQALDARLEAEIARERARLVGNAGAGVGARVAAGGQPSVPPSDGAGADAGPLCPVCGAPHAVAARFCAECGYRVREDGGGSGAPATSIHIQGQGTPGMQGAHEG